VLTFLTAFGHVNCFLHVAESDVYSN